MAVFRLASPSPTSAMRVRGSISRARRILVNGLLITYPAGAAVSVDHHFEVVGWIMGPT
jgi:hypothetical protein